MLKYFDGSVFNAPVQAIVNTVNTMGAMGAGIALEFSLRYPDMFDDYVEKCKNENIKVGKVDYFRTTDKIIVNFPTKWHFKYPSRMEWIEGGLVDFMNTYKQNGVTSVAFPKLGCANGKLNWIDVKRVMEKYLSDLDIDVYICLDSLSEAQGKEKEMLDLFNSYDLNVLSEKIKLKANQVEYLNLRKPFKRFWQIGVEKPIKGAAYKKIFNFFDNYKPEESEQLSLF